MSDILTKERKRVPDFTGRLYTGEELHGIAGTWVRRAEVDVLLDEIERLHGLMHGIEEQVRQLQHERDAEHSPEPGAGVSFKEHDRYKRCLYRANGRLIQLGQEPEKLDYPSQDKCGSAANSGDDVLTPDPTTSPERRTGGVSALPPGEPASREASPADLVGALQDVAHTDPGPVRVARAIREWHFDRYRNGKLMAQGVNVHAANYAEAYEKAGRMLFIDGNKPSDELRLAVKSREQQS